MSKLYGRYGGAVATTVKTSDRDDKRRKMHCLRSSQNEGTKVLTRAGSSSTPIRTPSRSGVKRCVVESEASDSLKEAPITVE